MIDPTVSACHVGDCRALLEQLPDGCVQTCVTSPPYWGLRDYGVDGQLGLEQSPAEYVANMVEVFRGVRRVLRDDGTLWLNLGDSYAATTKGSGGTSSTTIGNGRGQSTNPGALYGLRKFTLPTGLKPKDLVGIPWMTAFALREDGWYLRSDVVWNNPRSMPSSVSDRPTKSHEYVFLLSKSDRYFYDADAIAEPATGRSSDGANEFHTRNKRSVWTIAGSAYSGAHFATMPPDLVKPCVLAGSRTGDLVLDPFFGSGTVGMVAESLGRRWIGIELNPEYVKLSIERTRQRGLAL